MRLGRLGLLLAVLAAWPADVRAEILVAPFLGGAFAGRTTLPIFDIPTVNPSALSKSLVFGIAGMWLGSGIVGLEGELASVPGFFDLASRNSAFVNSNVTTASGSVVVTAPLNFTRESLRPYVTGGLGLLQVGITTRAGIADVDRTLLALNLGGGAIGMLNDRVGLRFDLRHTRSVRDDTAPAGQTGSRVRLSFWRATVGVVIRY